MSLRICGSMGKLVGAVALVTAGFLVAIAGEAQAADPWPGSGGTKIAETGASGSLPSGSEPSGGVWHPGLDALLIADDNGRLSRIDASGGNVATWVIGGDLEGVTFVDPSSDLVYLGRERPDAVIEFNLATGLATGNTWDLTPWMTGDSNLGLEALTYANGRFYAGHQGEGNVYVFTLGVAGAVTHHATFPSPGGSDLAGLHYDADTETLFAIHDFGNLILELTLTGSEIRRFDLPGNDQEGVALLSNCTTGEATLWISHDDGDVWRYDNYPITCVAPDTDGDGTPDDTDLDDDNDTHPDVIEEMAGSDPLDPASTPTSVVVPALGATGQAVLWGWLAAVGLATLRPRRG